MITEIRIQKLLTNLGFKIRKSSTPDEIESRKPIDIRLFYIKPPKDHVIMVVFVNGILEEDRKKLHRILLLEDIRHNFHGKFLTIHQV